MLKKAREEGIVVEMMSCWLIGLELNLTYCWPAQTVATGRDVVLYGFSNTQLIINNY